MLVNIEGVVRQTCRYLHEHPRPAAMCLYSEPLWCCCTSSTAAQGQFMLQNIPVISKYNNSNF